MPLSYRVSRATGIMYVGLFIFGMMGPLVLEGILVPGDAAATAANLEESMTMFQVSIVAWFMIIALDLLISVTLYWLFRELRPIGSRVVGASRLLYTVMLAPSLIFLAQVTAVDLGTGDGQAAALASLQGLTTGFTVALVFFGMHLASLALVGRDAMPKWVTVPLGLAALAYIVDNGLKVMGSSALAGAADIVMVVALLGELALLIWFFVVGRGTGTEAA